ncbi:hypothetical protein B0H66DRAFT_532958 [Apodospora peruviana]|uniref:Uncharacterized protein n=1 Tax=Apodospora peruviana TaxID=516989 RepID=A0AAE0I6D9_9PEZI|nr:hypothetical protein B0H66DRAFT_532958 [Apodospora peruviana]
MTSTLFATTVAASFFVVALPHILPCPAPRVAFADSEMSEGGIKRRRRRVRPANPDPEPTKDGIIQFQASSSSPVDEDGAEALTSSKRECPVPKPKGVLGDLLGFTSKEKSSNDEGNVRSRPVR